ncbi:retrovirus-related pol polyprotein from transposon TNT 1-94 [Tanacetum coccineum]
MSVLRFTLLLNDIDISTMRWSIFNVKTQVLNTLPVEWKQFVTDVNWLRTSSNPRQQATIYDGKVTVQPVQGRHTSYAAGTTRKYTLGASGNNTGKPRTVICYNCKGDGHIAKQCTKPKRKRDETWIMMFKNLDSHHLTMLLIKPDDLDAYDSDCDELIQSNLLMANSQGVDRLHS